MAETAFELLLDTEFSSSAAEKPSKKKKQGIGHIQEHNPHEWTDKLTAKRRLGARTGGGDKPSQGL